jgi:hypothetical protein
MPAGSSVGSDRQKSVGEHPGERKSEATNKKNEDRFSSRLDVLSCHGDNRFMREFTLHYAANFTGAWRNPF